jgi:hypothetical protein
MARKTETAFGNFVAGSALGSMANNRIIPIDGVDSNLEEINSRCMIIGGSLAAIADGLSELAGAIADVYDKLDAMDRKNS